MTPEEAELLRAVAEAAKDIVRARASKTATWEDLVAAIGVCEAALSALAAYRAQPQEAEGEMVIMGLMRGRHGGRLNGMMEPDQEDPRVWQHIGNIVFQMPPDVVLPTIPAKVVT